MKREHFLISILALMMSSISCKKDSMAPDPIRRYIFLGHIYKASNEIDDRVANLNFQNYSQIWLGGDVCSETSAEQSTLDYLDSLLHVSDTDTKWALGNHDIRNGNISLITDKTGRNTFYSSTFDGITLLVLNTNFSYGGIYDTLQINTQYELIKNVCDTIQKSSYLIILEHNTVWANLDSTNHVQEYTNGDLSQLLFSINPNLTYENGVYPLLKNVRARGVKVIQIAGDFGQKASTYQYTTAEDIQFIVSGITSNIPYNEQYPTAGQPDSILVLYHNIEKQTIDWSFQRLD
jgi:hypothetical protein